MLTCEKTNGEWGSWKDKMSEDSGEKKEARRTGWESAKLNTNTEGRDTGQEILRRRRIGGMNVERKRKAGPERKVWAYLAGQALVRSLQTDWGGRMYRMGRWNRFTDWRKGQNYLQSLKNFQTTTHAASKCKHLMKHWNILLNVTKGIWNLFIHFQCWGVHLSL